jgi:hypothetical protein
VVAPGFVPVHVLHDWAHVFVLFVVHEEVAVVVIWVKTVSVGKWWAMVPRPEPLEGRLVWAIVIDGLLSQCII